MYHHAGWNISTLVHGDDYVSVGSEEAMQWLKMKLEGDYEIKTVMIGKRKGLEKEGRVLNRVVRWTHEGWEYEADQRHSEIIVKETEMDQAKPVTTPSAEEKEEESDEEVLGGDGARWYRGVAARGNYLSLDRPDLAYASKEASR